MRKQNKKILPASFSFFNIGTVLFGVIFIYMIICLIMYLTTDHITAYEVTAGPLAGNYRYSALALRSEKVVKADQSGNISYYTREGAKAGMGTAVCSIGESGGFTSLAPTKVKGNDQKEAENKVSSLDEKVLADLKDDISAFALSFQEGSFQNTYNFKGNLESSIMEASYEGQAAADNGSIINACTTEQEGVVVFSIDGYEEKTPEAITAKDFDQKNYSQKRLRLNKSVKTGDPIYKLVTDETWNLLIPLDKKMATELASEKSVKFRFLKEDTTLYADFAILKKGNDYFGQLTLNKCMGSYASERFVDIELMLNRKTGLKIPASAIAKRQFYKIPEEYASYDEEETDSPSEISVIREITRKDGSVEQKQVMATVYDKVEGGFLVDCSLFEEGDYILMRDSSKRYLISETEVLEGVYNINKGYAIFREINIVDENEEYCIVEEGSTFGLSQYDHIVLNADTVNDEDIVIHY